MTVIRKATKTFATDAATAAKAVRVVLGQHPPYWDNKEILPYRRYSTTVKPHWFLASTEMEIEITEVGGMTEVSARTKSQWYVQGDVFNYYNKYINTFLFDLETHLQTCQPHNQALERTAMAAFRTHFS